MRILICDPIDAEGLEKLRSAGHVVDAKTGLAAEVLVKEVAGYEGLVVRSATKVTKAVVDAATSLKFVMRGGVGLDNIDAAACEARGIRVLNTPEAATLSVAEHAIAMMFAAARRIGRAHELLRQGKWDKKSLVGNEINGKTLGLVGLGRIGMEVAIRARALGMTVIANRRNVKTQTPPGVGLVDLNDLLARADYISIHVPFTPETRNILGAAEFAKMKKGVILVNCSRGGIVDEGALVAALRSGAVAMAAVDVFDEEPPRPDHPLLRLDNVVVTPHIGASTWEGQNRVGMAVAEKLLEVYGPA